MFVWNQELTKNELKKGRKNYHLRSLQTFPKKTFPKGSPQVSGTSIFLLNKSKRERLLIGRFDLLVCSFLNQYIGNKQNEEGPTGSVKRLFCSSFVQPTQAGLDERGPYPSNAAEEANNPSYIIPSQYHID